MVLYLGPAAVEALLAIRPEEAVIDAVTPVFNLHPDTIRRRLQQAARAAGLPGWRDITGHSGRVGMAQDLSAAGFALPELMTAGRWKSPRMPARYTERQAAGRGAVARYYQGGRGVEARRRSPGKREPARWSPFSVAVHRHPRELGKAATRLCWTLYAALRVGVMLCVHHSLWRVGPPYNEEMKTMEKLTLTLHKTKDTKNKVVYGTKDGEVIQSVYIDKDALGDVPPATLQVVISAQ